MIDRFNPPITDLARSGRFYEQLLEPPGYRFLMQDGEAIGFGRDSWAFGIVVAQPPVRPIHLAFKADERGQVEACFRAAVAAGAAANGAPGIRAHYDPSYYAAYVLHPDGHNVEVVCRRKAPSDS